MNSTRRAQHSQSHPLQRGQRLKWPQLRQIILLHFPLCFRGSFFSDCLQTASTPLGGGPAAALRRSRRLAPVAILMPAGNSIGHGSSNAAIPVAPRPFLEVGASPRASFQKIRASFFCSHGNVKAEDSMEPQTMRSAQRESSTGLACGEYRRAHAAH